jgi:rhodanese-related sulfurtransferase
MTSGPLSGGSIRHVAVVEVPALIADGAVLVDVRERHETAVGHVPASILMPMQTFDIDRLPRGVPLVFICRSGSRSSAVATALAGMGYATFNVIGGVVSWQRAGLPLVTEDGRPGSVL